MLLVGLVVLVVAVVLVLVAVGAGVGGKGGDGRCGGVGSGGDTAKRNDTTRYKTKKNITKQTIRNVKKKTATKTQNQ